MEFNSNHKCSKITIDNKEYPVTLYLSAGDVFSVLDFISEGKKDYNSVVSKIVEKHIISNQPEHSLMNGTAVDNSALYMFISALLDEEESLKEHYDNYENESDFCKRFVYAINDEWKSLSEKTSIAVANTLKDNLAAINFHRSEILGNITKTANVVKKIIEPYIQISEKIANSFITISQKIGSILSDIKIPQISEERKAELCKSHEKWGEFGWSILPNAPIKLYNDPPKTQKEANEIAMLFCEKNDMLDLFENTKKLNGVKKKDFDEAIFDYQHKKYKSCAMIILSLIDAKLIRMQRKEDINPKTRRRDSGVLAAKNIKQHIEVEQDIDKKLFLLLSHKNLFACISAFFAGGGDFKNQPELANRNFIDHGMLTKNIRKRDCIQLFLLYHNLLEFFEILNI